MKPYFPQNQATLTDVLEGKKTRFYERVLTKIASALSPKHRRCLDALLAAYFTDLEEPHLSWHKKIVSIIGDFDVYRVVAQGEHTQYICQYVTSYQQAYDILVDEHKQKQLLYQHRHYLAILFLLQHRRQAWRSRADGTGARQAGWFLAGARLDVGDISYHFPDSMWQMLASVETRERAPPFDGHTSEQVAQRLLEQIHRECELRHVTGAYNW